MTKAKRGPRKPKISSTLNVEEVPKVSTTQSAPLPHEHCGGIKEPLDVRLQKADKELRENARKRRVRRANDLRGARDVTFSI